MHMAEQPGSQRELSSLVDTELVRAAQEGSASAARLIVRRHNQRLYRVARAIVRDDSEAEDVLQEAYLSAFRSLSSFRADASLSTWLTRIVANKAIGRLKRGDMAIPLDALDKVDWVQTEVVGMPHFDFDPERTATRSQVRELLERAIDNLPTSFRVVFVLRLVEQLSVKEAAASLGIPEETVKTRLHRAKKLMREQLQTELGSALTDTFPFQDPRCAAFTDALVAHLANTSEVGGYSHHGSSSTH
jgi:RNA polymerase sigma-70 factor (ECF subfamily)